MAIRIILQSDEQIKNPATEKQSADGKRSPMKRRLHYWLGMGIVLALLGGVTLVKDVIRPRPHRYGAPSVARSTVSSHRSSRDRMPTVVVEQIPHSTRFPLLATVAGAKAIVINEIHFAPASGSNAEEWVELYNRSSNEVDVGGWRLAGSLEFTFPAGTRLAPGGYLTVAADTKTFEKAWKARKALGSWKGHLPDDSGEVVLLTNGDNEADRVKYTDSPPFPAATSATGSSLERRNPNIDEVGPRNWGAGRAGGWTKVLLRGNATSSRLYLYLGGAGSALLDDLTIRQHGRVLYSDDFTKKRSGWSFRGNHAETAIVDRRSRTDNRALLIRASGGGATKDSAANLEVRRLDSGFPCEIEFWVQLADATTPLTARLSLSRETYGVFGKIDGARASPGASNSILAAHLPPLIHPVRHTPARPTSGDAMQIEAGVVADAPPSSVTVTFHVGRGRDPVFEELKMLATMRDDGTEGDAKAEDGIYTARLSKFPNGTLVNYTIEVLDDAGQPVVSPERGSPTTTYGFYVEDEDAQDADAGFPVYNVLLEKGQVTRLRSNRFSDAYEPATLVHNGVVYSGIGVRHRGQTSRHYPKLHWKLKLNRDLRAVLREGEPPVRTINLSSSYADKIFLRDYLSHKLWADLGEASSQCEHSILKINGEYHGLYVRIENPGSTYLARNGLAEGWLWKAYSGGTEPEGRYELEAGDPTRADEVLREFLTGLNQHTGEQLEKFLRANVQIDSMINFLVATQLVHNADHVQKNYLIYADPERRFTLLPWDMDLTHGRNFECSRDGLLNDRLRADMWEDEHGNNSLLFGTRDHPKCDGHVNGFVDAMLRRTKAFRQQYYDRLREALATHYDPEVLIPKARVWRDRLREAVERDRERWGTYEGDADFESQFNAFCDWVKRRHAHLTRRLAAH